MLLHMHDLSLLIEKDEIDWKEHSDRMHAPRRDDPKTAAKLRPAFGLSQ